MLQTPDARVSYEQSISISLSTKIKRLKLLHVILKQQGSTCQIRVQVSKMLRKQYIFLTDEFYYYTGGNSDTHHTTFNHIRHLIPRHLITATLNESFKIIATLRFITRDIYQKPKLFVLCSMERGTEKPWKGNLFQQR